MRQANADMSLLDSEADGQAKKETEDRRFP